jgi:hypothetical protein
MVRRFVDLDAVRASRVRLDALAVAHPELLSDENRARLAMALADLKGCDVDENDDENEEEESPDDVGEREADRTPTAGRRDCDTGAADTHGNG